MNNALSPTNSAYVSDCDVLVQPLVITTESPLPEGTVGDSYSMILQATGGTPPYTWAVVDSALPPGLTLNPSTGEIGGIPAAGATFNFTVQVTDSASNSTSKALQLVIQSFYTDLAISAADIRFDPAIPDPGQPVTIIAKVHNLGLTDASDVQVNLYDLSGPLGQTTVASLSAGTTSEVTFETTYAETSLHLISVKVNPDNVITELNEENNEASTVLQVGQPDLSQAVMVVEASAPTACQGDIVSVSGNAYYDFTQVPGVRDHPVQGANVTVTLLDPATDSPIGTFIGSYTNTDGNYSQAVIAPTADGTYPVVVEVTDKTITEEKRTTLTVSGACSQPTPTPSPTPTSSPTPTPSSTPTPTPSSTPTPSPTPHPFFYGDVSVRSEDIHFSNNNPDPGETINIFAFIHYQGSEPSHNIPVTIYDILPVNGVLQKIVIGTSQVSFPNVSSGTVVMSVPWTGNAEGAHIIQVVVEPPFDQYTKNDKATRLIIIGEVPQLTIMKTFALLLDADGDAIISPGDRLQYTISYENFGTGDATGAIIIDDYDDGLLAPPTVVSDGGTAVDGVITWNLGTLDPGKSGFVTYEIDIIPDDQFPPGRTIVRNVVLLTTDLTSPIADSAEVEVIVNVPPTVDAGKDETANEGENVPLTATGNDYDGDPLTYEWDLDDDGIFETPGQSVDFPADDGPSTHTVVVRVTDPGGLSATDQLNIEVLNVKPTVEPPTLDPEPSDEGESVTANATFSDPGVDDSPFTCTVNYGDGSGDLPGTVNANICTGPAHTYVDNGSFAVVVTVTDKDEDPGSNTATHEVNNVVPNSVVLIPDPTIIDENSTTDLNGSFIDPGTLDEHTVVIDWGDGVSETLILPVGERSFSAPHLYPDDVPTDTSTDVLSITVSIADNDGSSESADTAVTVNNVAPDVSDITIAVPVIEKGGIVNTSAEFSDVGTADTHRAVWDWGDGTQCDTDVDADCWVDEPSDTAPGSVYGSHTYVEPGVYTLSLLVFDDDTGTDGSIYQFVVVYDPEGGFVTGGGWIDSPVGACQYADCTDDTTGKANFGFVSKYKKGANQPTGTTEFQFKAGNLNFHSDRYDWLVVAGHKAKFKGTGTINGSGNYGFMISAIDEKLTPSTDVDLFRVKIWDKDNGDAVVYDNQIDTRDDADPTTAIGGGNIMIHSGNEGKSKSASAEQQDPSSSSMNDNTIFLPVIAN